MSLQMKCLKMPLGPFIIWGDLNETNTLVPVTQTAIRSAHIRVYTDRLRTGVVPKNPLLVYQLIIALRT